MNNVTTLAKKVDEAFTAWEQVIGDKRTRIMLKNTIVNAIEYYDKDKDGEIATHILKKIVEVMSREETIN